MKTVLYALLAVGVCGKAVSLPEMNGLVRRELTPWGGYPLLASTCPADTAACPVANKGDDPYCCPTGKQCQVHSDVTYCCPDSNDCSSTVIALAACADNSWNLVSFADFFCCLPDQYGIYKSGRQCLAKSLPVPTAEILTTYVQVTTSASVAGSKSTAAAGGGTSVGTTASSSPRTTSSGSSSSLITTSGIIGIAVAAVIVALIAFVLCWRRMSIHRRAQQQQQQLQQPQQEHLPTSTAALATYETPSFGAPSPYTPSPYDPSPYEPPAPGYQEMSAAQSTASRPAPHKPADPPMYEAP